MSSSALLRRFRGLSASVRSDERGASAIEFALLAPLLVLACLATVDLGLAINQKMDIDHSLRAGSEGAMIDLGQTEVRDLVEGIAAESLEVQSDDGDVETDADALAVSVSRFCACPENVSATVDCSTGTCEDAAKPYLYYRLSAEMQYDPFLLPEIPLRGSVLVQVK